MSFWHFFSVVFGNGLDWSGQPAHSSNVTTYTFKAGLLNGVTATSVCDITTAKKFSLGHHCAMLPRLCFAPKNYNKGCGAFNIPSLSNNNEAAVCDLPAISSHVYTNNKHARLCWPGMWWRVNACKRRQVASRLGCWASNRGRKQREVSTVFPKLGVGGPMWVPLRKSVLILLNNFKNKKNIVHYFPMSYLPYRPTLKCHQHANNTVMKMSYIIVCIGGCSSYLDRPLEVIV